MTHLLIDSVRSLGYLVGNRSERVADMELTVLKYSHAPAIMLEVGFSTNKHDLKYITDNTRQNEIAAKTVSAIDTFFKKYPPGPDTKGPTIESISFDASSPTYNTDFTIQANQVKDESGVKDVRFRIWNASKPTLRKVVQGKHDGNNNWTAPFSLNDFKMTYGTYRVTAYGTDYRGNDQNMGTKSITIREDNNPPTVKELVIEQSGQGKDTVYTLHAMDVASSSGVKDVRFRVWQPDVEGSGRTFVATKESGSYWSVFFTLEPWKHKLGTYLINVFTTDNNGNKGAAISGSLTVYLRQNHNSKHDSCALAVNEYNSHLLDGFFFF